ncbi:hypothetical protein ACL90Y_10990 [Micrococcus luteus]
MSEQGMERVSLADVQFPLRVRVRTGVWAPAFVMAVVLWVLFVPIILGVPSSLFETDSAMLPLLRVLAGIGFLPLSLYVAYTWMAWRRPRHLTVDEEAVWTDSWRVRWEDVRSVWLNPTHGQAPDKKTQVAFLMEKRVWTDELRRGNRWDSGYPFGLGGMLCRDGTVKTQFATDPPIQSLFGLFEQLRMQARGEKPEDATAHG